MSRDENHEPLEPALMRELVEYSDGALDAEAAIRLEERLGKDPRLRAELEAFMDVDAELSLVAGDEGLRGQETQRRPWLWRWGATLAIAASLLLVLLVWRSSRPGELEVQIAVVENQASWELYCGQNQELAGREGAIRRLTRGTVEPQAEDLSDSKQLLQESGRVQLRLEQEAMQRMAPLRSNFFLIPIKLQEPRAISVFLCPEEGGIQRVFPREDEEERIAWLERGDHVLPRPALGADPEADGALRFERGFVVPRDTGRVQVIVALHESRVDAESFATNAPVGAQHSAEELRQTLDETGFERVEFVVIEVPD